MNRIMGTSNEGSGDHEREAGPDPSEQGLVAAARNGSVEAFSTLARRYQERIYHTILRFTRDPEDAGDLTQETFMAAYISLRSFRQGAGFYTWIFRIAVNSTLNFLKKKGREKNRTEFRKDVDSMSVPGGPPDSPEEESMRNELGRNLGEAIDGLPLPFRSSFILVVHEGMSHADAAGVLGCSENTVSWRMHKARKLLQRKLKPYLDEVRHGVS